MSKALTVNMIEALIYLIVPLVLLGSFMSYGAFGEAGGFDVVKGKEGVIPRILQWSYSKKVKWPHDRAILFMVVFVLGSALSISGYFQRVGKSGFCQVVSTVNAMLILFLIGYLWVWYVGS